ncbi:RHS repeat-associated core domain-containing protein [Bordetella sp. LUAb4]|uniref:RHS repeat-associated core domain-containing protein n=1 Tax=Bordetella sp. LUAb4 TaxID=2843195 RepID=UPI001E313A5C|nr:RHS repeat-associated core domain-containing protein [Bordetella sp. LUAb4]
MSGEALQTVSVDAGTSKACADIAGQPIRQYSEGRDANLPSDKKITVLLSYDALGRPEQRSCFTAEVSGGGSLGGPTDIWSYGDYSGLPGATYDPADTTDPRNANQRGQVLQHFDTAGLVDMSTQGYAVQGTTLRQDRRFLATPCDATTHWDAGTPQALYGLNKQWLEPDTDLANLYSTQWAYNALGQVLTQVDAKGHQQQTAYDCAGRKSTASVTPNGGTLTPVCVGITYNAAGAIDTRTDANNIQLSYAYEPQTTQRLIALTTSRAAAAGNAAQRLSKPQVTGKDTKSLSGKPARADTSFLRANTTPLQALTYAYDGVGNVISLSDSSASAQVRFFRNRAVTPDRGYTYDALYQLTSASGRKNYVNNTPKGTDWPGAQFYPATTSDYQAYTRTYTYDLGGNLTSIGSSNWSGAAPPMRQLVVSTASNRAVSTANNPGATQANIDTYFDPAGKSIFLDANRNQPMYWTAFHQLYCVVTTYRAPTPSTNANTNTGTGTGTGTGDWSNSDREQYAYDGSGQRMRKYASSLASSPASGIWNSLDTRYLPGLELRGNSASGENLEVIVLDDGVRVLNWAGGTGKPSDIPNLQLRFQYSDRQNACQIETDKDGNVITQEEYYPYGGTAVLASRSDSEVKYKYIRYCGKERDATGLYYYGLRYYQPWIGRWINPDPAGTVDGQNLYCMVGNNPVTLRDETGLARKRKAAPSEPAREKRQPAISPSGTASTSAPDATSVQPPSTPAPSSPIPRDIHYMWFGNNISRADLSNILITAEQNPRHAIHIFTDRKMSIFSTLDKLAHLYEENPIPASGPAPATFQPASEAGDVALQPAPSANRDRSPDALQRYLANKHGGRLYVHDISDLFNSFQAESTEGERNELSFTPQETRTITSRFYREMNGAYRNYASASDIGRGVLMKMRGGLYLDVDLAQRYGFDDLHPPGRFMLAEPAMQGRSVDEAGNIRPQFVWVSNAVLASYPDSDGAKRLLRTMSTLTDRYDLGLPPGTDSRIIYRANNRTQYSWTNKRTVDRLHGTVLTTGPRAISVAGLMRNDEREDLFSLHALGRREYTGIPLPTRPELEAPQTRNDILMRGWKMGMDATAGWSTPDLSKARRSSI